MIALATILTTSVNLAGYAGVIMFAAGGLYGVGAYTYANFSLNLGMPSIVSLLAAAGVATLVGLIMTLASLRLQGIYFALSTLIGNLILSAIFFNVTDLTAGPRGMSAIPPPTIGLPGIGEIVFIDYLQTYLVMAIAIAWIYGVWRMVNGRMGRYLEALREDEILAPTLGIDILKYRLIAFLPSTAMIGLAGGLYAAYTTAITPENFDIFVSFTILTFVNVGGRGTISGPVIAAIFLTAIVYVFDPIYLVRNLLYGSLLIFVILLSPDGLMGILKDLKVRVAQRRVARSAT
ncbi:MAG: branched-chain amino acid ABC transporter permease [Proteobacteria bacterium]|nr:branched-chain amino acid ABC transporter permease [Pseudomonadota bacterium]